MRFQRQFSTTHPVQAETSSSTILWLRCQPCDNRNHICILYKQYGTTINEACITLNLKWVLTNMSTMPKDWAYNNIVSIWLQKMHIISPGHDILFSVAQGFSSLGSFLQKLLAQRKGLPEHMPKASVTS